MTTFVPAGDPEAMRAAARALVARADGIRLAPEGSVAGFEALVLEGPAARRLQMAAGEVRNGAQQAGAGLEAVAAELYADAATVERCNEERRLAQPGAPSPEPPAPAPAPAAAPPAP